MNNQSNTHDLSDKSDNNQILTASFRSPVKIFWIFADAIELSAIDAFDILLTTGHVEESVSSRRGALSRESLRHDRRLWLLRRGDVIIVVIVVPAVRVVPAVGVGVPHSVIPSAGAPRSVVVTDGGDGVGVSRRFPRRRRFCRTSSHRVRSSSSSS